LKAKKIENDIIYQEDFKRKFIKLDIKIPLALLFIYVLLFRRSESRSKE